MQISYDIQIVRMRHTRREEHDPEEPLNDVYRDETSTSSMINDPLVEDPDSQTTLDKKTEESLTGPDKIVRPSSPDIEEISADDPSDAPSRVLNTGYTELDVWVGDPSCGEDDSVVIGENGPAVPS